MPDVMGAACGGNGWVRVFNRRVLRGFDGVGRRVLNRRLGSFLHGVLDRRDLRCRLRLGRDRFGRQERFNAAHCGRLGRLGKGIEQRDAGCGLGWRRRLDLLRRGGRGPSRRSLGCSLNTLFARGLRHGLARGCRRSGRRLDQRDQADIGAAADPLQHHLADADRRFGAA